MKLCKALFEIEIMNKSRNIENLEFFHHDITFINIQANENYDDLADKSWLYAMYVYVYQHEL